jgi:RNA polymerase sigma factor (sigma-70 family)
MTDDEIRDLCARLRANEKGAVESMFLYVASQLRPLASKILRLDFPRIALQAETDDILHDVLCKLIPYLRQTGEDFCSGTGPFHRLTATVLRRTLISLARKHFGSLNGRALGVQGDAAVPELWQSSGLDSWRSRLRVHELVEKLEEPDQEVIDLAIYTNLSNAEIAKCLKISPGNASRRLSRAKERLGRLLREDDQAAE